MAELTVDLSNLTAISKEVFPEGDQYWVQIDRKTPALDLIESTDKIPFDGRTASDGRAWYFPVATSGHANPAVGSSGESAGLPSAGRMEMDRVVFNKASHWQALQISGEAIDTMIGGEYSIQDGLQLQMREQMPEARKEFNRLVHGDGSGLIASPTSFTANTITMDSTAYLRVGTELSIIDLDDSTTQYPSTTTNAVLKVSSVDSSTVVTVTDGDGGNPGLTVGSSTAYGLYRYNSQGRSINGFGIMCHDANPSNWGSATSYYGGINRSTANAWWQAYRLNANSSTISVMNHIQPMIDTLRRRAGEYLRPGSDGVLWYGFTGYQNMRIIGNALKADQRTAPNYMTLKGGWKGVEYEGAVFVIDDDAPASRIRFVHPGSVRRYVNRPWFWDDRTGAIWKRATATDGRDADVFKAYMYTRQQLISVRSRTMGEIYGTTATS